MKKIKKFLLAAVFFCTLLPAMAESKIVCDDETGICRIVEEPENSSAKTVQQSDHQLELVRKQIGLTGKEEFLAFLKGEPGTAVPTALWGVLLLAFFGGLALNLTPCVLPMLPINLAIIGASGGGRGFRRGLLYGGAMAVTYGILGLLAAFAGTNFGTLNSSPWFNFAVSLIFILLSLAMMGVFNVDLSSRFHLNPKQLNLSGDMTALFMGALSALLAGACVAPVVISVLIFAAGNPVYGWLAPLLLGIGMALPWPLAGAGLSVLPKPGKYMVHLKHIFALIIFLAAAYYMHTGFKLLPRNEAEFQVDGIAALQAAGINSRRTGKPVLVKFTASWCKNCHAMENGRHMRFCPDYSRLQIHR